jgi:hypothetical protein
VLCLCVLRCVPITIHLQDNDLFLQTKCECVREYKRFYCTSINRVTLEFIINILEGMRTSYGDSITNFKWRSRHWKDIYCYCS